MASFFWIGNAANWATNNWASTSGGVSNGSQPGAGDDAIFDQNSPGNCTVTVSTAVRSLDLRGTNPDGTHDFTHTLTVNSAIILTLGTSTSNGTLSLRLSPSMTLTFVSQTSGGFTFASTSGVVEQITTNGKRMATTVFNGAGGSWQLQDAFTANGNVATTMTLTAGTLDLNGKYVTLGKFASSNSTARALSFNGGTIELQATSGTAWNMATVSGLTLNASNGTISLTGFGSMTFAGGGKTYGALSIGSSVSQVTFTGSNAFGAVSGTTVSFIATASSTMTVASLTTTNGGSTLQSTAPGTAFTLACTAGMVLSASGASHNTVADCIASGGIPFYAGHGATLTNTTSWVAADAPVFSNIRAARRGPLRPLRARAGQTPPLGEQAIPRPRPRPRSLTVAQPRARLNRGVPTHQTPAPAPRPKSPGRTARSRPNRPLPVPPSHVPPPSRRPPLVRLLRLGPRPHRAMPVPQSWVLQATARSRVRLLAPTRPGRTLIFRAPIPGTVPASGFGPGFSTPTAQFSLTHPAESMALSASGQLRGATSPRQEVGLSRPAATQAGTFTGPVSSSGAPTSRQAQTSPTGRTAEGAPAQDADGTTRPDQRTGRSSPENER